MILIEIEREWELNADIAYTLKKSFFKKICVSRIIINIIDGICKF
jgi:hypothetical protein